MAMLVYRRVLPPKKTNDSLPLKNGWDSNDGFGASLTSKFGPLDSGDDSFRENFRLGRGLYFQGVLSGVIIPGSSKYVFVLPTFHPKNSKKPIKR